MSASESSPTASESAAQTVQERPGGWFAGLKRFFWPPVRAHTELEDRLAWLVWLRWLMVAGQLLSLSLAARLMFIPWSLFPWLLGLSVGLAGFNLLACRSLHRRLPAARREVELLASLLLDLLVFLILLSLTHGIHNPFYPLIFAYALLGSVLLPAHLGWAYLFSLSVGLYLLNPVVYVFNTQLTYIRLSALVAWGIQLLVLLAVWLIAGSVSRRLLSWRQQAEKLQQQQHSLQKVHLLGALGAGVAHEFATPLNTLRLRLERLQRQHADSADLQVASKALAQCESRLRQMAALPTQASLLQTEPVLLLAYLETYLLDWQARHPQVRLHTELAIAAELTLQLPELALQQILDNLLSNAVEAMQGQGELQLTLKQNTAQVQLSLCDQGPGWPESVRQHVGEPFISTRSEGTGLGLYTVFMLVQSLGGNLQLSPNLPQGACIQICLPRHLPPAC